MKFLPRNAIVLILSLIFLAGCSAKTLEKAQRHAVLAKCDELVQCYLSQDVYGARSCLHQQADLLEQSPILEPIGRYASLAITYSRLYVLEKRDGKTLQAEADLLKAKFWSLKRAEKDGTALDIAMKQIEDSSFDNLVATINEKDRTINDGKLPAYIGGLHFTNSPVGQN